MQLQHQGQNQGASTPATTAAVAAMGEATVSATTGAETTTTKTRTPALGALASSVVLRITRLRDARSDSSSDSSSSTTVNSLGSSSSSGSASSCSSTEPMQQFVQQQPVQQLVQQLVQQQPAQQIVQQQPRQQLPVQQVQLQPQMVNYVDNFGTCLEDNVGVISDTPLSPQACNSSNSPCLNRSCRRATTPVSGSSTSSGDVILGVHVGQGTMGGTPRSAYPNPGPILDYRLEPALRMVEPVGDDRMLEPSCIPCMDQSCTSWTTCSYPECNKVARNTAKDVAREPHEQPACQLRYPADNGGKFPEHLAGQSAHLP